jgi:hypothetical protein
MIIINKEEGGVRDRIYLLRRKKATKLDKQTSKLTRRPENEK